MVPVRDYKKKIRESFRDYEDTDVLTRASFFFFRWVRVICGTYIVIIEKLKQMHIIKNIPCTCHARYSCRITFFPECIVRERKRSMHV